MTGNRLIVVILALFAIAGLVAVVMLSIGLNKLGDLIGGLLVAGLIVVSLAAIGVALFRVAAPHMLKSNAERNRHTETMVKAGYLPQYRNVRYEPIQTLQAAPQPEAPKQIAPPSSGIHFTDSELETNVVNLLLFSVQLLGEESNRIASGPECAQANIPGYNGRKWDKMMHEYLEPNYGIATVPGPVKNGGGAFVSEKIGTVGKLYHEIVFKKQMDGLPTTRR